MIAGLVWLVRYESYSLYVIAGLPPDARLLPVVVIMEVRPR